MPIQSLKLPAVGSLGLRSILGEQGSLLPSTECIFVLDPRSVAWNTLLFNQANAMLAYWRCCLSQEVTAQMYEVVHVSQGLTINYVHQKVA